MTEQLDLFDGARKDAFRRFHEAHPEVYAELRRQALKAVREDDTEFIHGERPCNS